MLLRKSHSNLILFHCQTHRYCNVFLMLKLLPTMKRSRLYRNSFRSRTTRFTSLFSLLFLFWIVVIVRIVTHSDESTHKIHFILFTTIRMLLRKSHSNLFLFYCQRMRPPCVHSFLKAKISLNIWLTLPTKSKSIEDFPKPYPVFWLMIFSVDFRRPSRGYV